MTSAAESFTFRKCCEGSTSPAIFAETEDRPSLGRGDVVQFTEPIHVVRDLRLARHEASHAVVACALGVPLAEVRVDPPAQAICAAPVEDAKARVALALAGPVADALFDGVKPITICAVGFRTLMRRIRSCRFGKCDECSAGLNSLGAAGGTKASDRDAFRIFRRAERAVAAFLQSPETEVAVANLARVLMEVGAIDGVTASKIIDETTLPTLEL